MVRRFLYLFIILAIASMACSFSTGGGNTEPTAAVVAGSEATVEVEATEAPSEEAPADDDSGAISSLEDIESATIQIVAEGTFVDPEVGLMMNAAGAGSGFIIDEEGIAVTNNHVVTGAAMLKVYVAGESKPHNAKVLGVSECSDLAVIDIDGDDFPYMQWADDDLKVGTDVYAAGFPLGDPEFTLTRGIISKASADGETGWASVDNVIEHDATINPGNSGGPLVNMDGQVVGVNYAGNNANQYFAISPEEALDVIEILREGGDVTSLGINGEAVMSEDGSLSGIWVSSVASGSPADEAGIQGGDIVTHLENIALATDGTMADYCDILRSHDPEDTLSVTVLRFADSTVLEGQINGRPLETAMSFAQELGDDVETDDSGSTGGYGDYVRVTDDTEAVEVEIPGEWDEIDGTVWQTTWDLGGSTIDISAPSIAAAADVNAYWNGYDESGVFFAASSDLSRTGGYVQLLDGVKGWYEGDCRIDSRNDYEDDLYEGKYDLWTDCGSNDTSVLVLSARPKDDPTAFLILLEVKITKEADLEVIDHILNTFIVVGGV